MSNLDDLPGQLTELRDLIRQAHEVTRDLRHAMREAAALRDTLPAAAENAVTERFHAEVESGMAVFQESLDKAIEDATRAVFSRFSRIEKLLLGEDEKSIRAGRPSLPEMIRMLAAEVPPAYRKAKLHGETCGGGDGI